MLIGLLVESFQNLQADSQQETVQLLRQISAQTNSYTLVGSHLNSTVPFSDPTAAPFEAHASDILVNVCWFASLVLSLAAASFAILVKQWLKEYLAIDRSRPEERLRIRHFRQGGLETWKLFEIAAVLPLILQLALTLFFIGLCVFTSSVHASVGTTCICLVGGWAAFFGFALLAPILSPRCPYKTTFLKRVLSTTRIYALSATKYSLGHLTPTWIWLCSSMLAASSRLSGVVQWTLEVAENAGRLARWTFTTLYHAILQNANSSSTTSEASQGCFKQIKDVVLKNEESQICRTNENDVLIVTGIDEMLNDELLASMEPALRQTCPPLQDAVQFTMNSAERRLNVQPLWDQMLAADLNDLPDLSELLDATRISMINIVADSLNKAVNQAEWGEPIKEGDREHAALAWRFLVILLAKWEQPVPGRVLELTRSISAHGMFAGCMHRPFTMGERPYGLSKVTHSICDVLCSLDASLAAYVLIVFFQCYFWKGDPQDTCISRWLLEERLHWSNVRNDVPFGSLVALVELGLTAVCSVHYQREAAGEILTLPSPGEMELIECTLAAIPLILKMRPDHNFDENTVPRALMSPLRVLGRLFRWPGALPHLLNCILAQSDLWTCKPRDLLLSALTYQWCASFNASHLYKAQN